LVEVKSNLTNPLSVSNIAWDPHQDAQVREVLTASPVRLIDVAPGKIFDDPLSVSQWEASDFVSQWGASGFKFFGMQSLLFGTKGFNVFGNTGVQDRMLAYLDGICRLGDLLGVRRLVFGSPKNRDRSGIDHNDSLVIAERFFKELAIRALHHGVVVCLEPNPPSYGCNFLTDTLSAAEFVARVNHPGLALQLDAGAAACAGEDVDLLLREHGELVGHVHLSRPNLVPLEKDDDILAVFAHAVQGHLPGIPVTIETLPSASADNLASLAQSIRVASILFEKRY
jgi:D-psicose/D-tagatose/L-ribulose 3-epimerase